MTQNHPKSSQNHPSSSQNHPKSYPKSSKPILKSSKIIQFHPKSSPNHPKSWKRAESKSVHAATRRAMRRIKLSAPVAPNCDSGGKLTAFNGNIHGIYPLVICYIAIENGQL